MSKIAAAGIDLGTSNSKIGVFKDGKVEIVPNSIGDTSTPSIVAILDKGEAIGEETILYKVDEKHTISQIKRLIGKNISDLKDFKDINYKIIGNNNNLQIEVNRNGKIEMFTPEQILALIIQKLIKNASDFIECQINKAVIAVPTYFDSNQRTAISLSAKMAGIEELELIDEPTAAALAYGLGKKENLSDSISLTIIKKDNKTFRKVLVFDLGGAAFDVSILTIKNTDFNVIAKLGDTNLGGIDFDNKLINFCLKDFCQKMKVQEQDILKDVNALKRLRVQCEKGKKLLSKNDKITINIYNFFNGHDLTVEISRTQFDEECEDFYIKIENILSQVLTESKFSKDEIDDIILVGGSSKIPKIREILLKFFNPEKIREKINQDEAVVIGATWQSHYFAKKFQNLKVSDILSSSLGVGSINKIREERKFGLIMSVLIPKGSKLPATSEIKKYKTVKDNQKNFKIKVYSGEERIASNNKFLGEIIIDNLPPGKANSVSFTILFKVDTNGIVTVNAEVSSIGIKIQKQYSLYDNKTYVENSPTIISLNKNSESKKKLEEIKDISRNINEKNKSLNDSQNNNDKIQILEQLCQYCLKIINIYTLLRKDNDSENLYEKYFYYTKLLFKYYSKIIILDTEDKNSNDILNKIQNEIPNFINDNIEDIIESFEELKIHKPKKYMELILYIVEILYKEGDRILKERKKYAKYYSTKFYKKAEQIKKIIDENENLKRQMDLKLKTRFIEIEENYGTKLSEIKAFACLIKDELEKKDTEFLPKTGLTIIRNKIKTAEDIYFIIDIYQEMANSFSKSKVPSEIHAYCLANIIKINFEIFKNYDFQFYKILNGKINYILDRLAQENEDDDDDDDNEKKPKPEWYQQLMEVNQKIDKKKKEIEDEENKQNEIIKKEIDSINENYKNIVENNKPNEFIFFILEKYPFINFNKSKIEDFKQKSLEELLKEIGPYYHPDNYKDRKDYKIYHEIYLLLVNIENKFIKKI